MKTAINQTGWGSWAKVRGTTVDWRRFVREAKAAVYDGIELGKGDLDVAACVRELRRVGYTGWLTVELDKKWAVDDPRTPLDSARICRQYLEERCR